MIEFKYKLPSFYLKEPMNGQYNNPELILPGLLSTVDPHMGEFLHILHNQVADERRLVFADNQVLICCHNWIRDHVYMMKAFKHYEYRLKSFLDFIIKHQTQEGFYYELLKQYDDEHWKFVNPDCYILYPDENQTLVRLEIENDVEYLVVEGVWQYYRATGDKKYVKEVLPSLEKAINYTITSPKRFSKEYGLVIRAYTIDTWDFTYEESSGTDRRIHDNQPMCAMHGDNSGVYQAMKLLAKFNRLVHANNAEYWEEKAAILKANIFKYLWNGKFFVHQFPINCKPYDDKENIRLSLSNPYDINRGLTNLSQSRKIIHEYQSRGKKTDAFCEFFCIDPAYHPDFKGIKEDVYMNGSISPFVAAELALASFNNGEEEYGFHIIKQFQDICLKEGKISFLYNRHFDGTQNGTGPSGWGAAAFVNAIDEGLFGIVDQSCLYKDMLFAPRLAIADFEEIRYFTGYEESDVYVDVRYTHNEVGMRYDIHSQKTKKVSAHILLPKDKTCSKALLNGQEVQFRLKKVAKSTYVDFKFDHHEVSKIEILY